MPHEHNFIQSGNPASQSIANSTSIRGIAKPAVHHPVKPVQRQKILVGNKVVHINDYHFITRLKHSKRPESGAHDVIITDFNDFEGLADAAKLNPGGNFKYGGVEWGWRGETELFPVADGINCLKLSSPHIEQLIYHAQEGGAPNKELKEKNESKKALEALQSGAGKKQQVDLQQLHLPLVITIGSLPSNIKFEPGKYFDVSLEKGGNKVEGFLMGPNGRREEGPHIHIFFECSPKKEDEDLRDRKLTIIDYVCTTKGKKHLNLIDGKIVDKKGGSGAQQSTSNELKEIEEMTAMIGMLNRLRPASVTKESKKVEPQEIKSWGKMEEYEDKMDGNIKYLAKMYGVREKVMEHFLKTTLGLDAEAIFLLVDSPEKAEDWGISIIELKWISNLDSKGIEKGKSEDDIMKLLIGYPTDPGKIENYYRGIIEKL